VDCANDHTEQCCVDDARIELLTAFSFFRGATHMRGYALLCSSSPHDALRQQRIISPFFTIQHEKGGSGWQVMMEMKMDLAA